jgi:hypothetical protein
MVAGQRLTATSALTPIAHATRRAGDCVGPAATIAGFVVSLMTAAIEPELSSGPMRRRLGRRRGFGNGRAERGP